MKKIRINELARELEVKAHEILERLPEVGVTEKKTHSSSIDEDVAIRLRRLYGHDVPDYVPDESDLAEAGQEAAPEPAEMGRTARLQKPARRPAHFRQCGRKGRRNTWRKGRPWLLRAPPSGRLVPPPRFVHRCARTSHSSAGAGGASARKAPRSR